MTVERWLPGDPQPAPEWYTLEKPTLVIGVDDCQAFYDKCISAGATEQMPVTHMPGVGTLAYFKDPDHNIFGIIEPEMDPPT